MATRSKQNAASKPDPNRLAAIKKQCENRVFLLNGKYICILLLFLVAFQR